MEKIAFEGNSHFEIPRSFRESRLPKRRSFGERLQLKAGKTVIEGICLLLRFTITITPSFVYDIALSQIRTQSCVS